MGVAKLREAFNEVAEPRFSAEKAFLGYEAANDTQWQRLTFSGIGKDGQPFEVRSERLRPNTDVILAAAATSKKFLDDNPEPAK